MAKYHFIDANGYRIEATGSEIKRLAAEGTITPETIVEFPDGKKSLAKDITGLTFPQNPFLMKESDIVKIQKEPPSNYSPVCSVFGNFGSSFVE